MGCCHYIRGAIRVILSPEHNQVEELHNQYHLDLGESVAIALALKLNAYVMIN